MDTLKKIIRFGLFGIILFVLYIFIRLIVESNFFGYKESNDLFRPKKLGIINDTIVKQLIVKSLYVNSYNDSIYILKYKKEFQIILWRIEQFSNISIRDIIEDSHNQMTIEKGNNYSDIIVCENPLVEIKARNRLGKEHKLKICFSDKGSIKQFNKNKNFIYLDMKCDEIGLSLSPNYCDLLINKGSHSSSNLLVYNSSGRFYVIFLYSLYNRDIRSDMLYKMININKI